MAKIKVAYVCSACGAQHPKWSGQCVDCQEWNSLNEEVVSSATRRTDALTGYANAVGAGLKLLSQIDTVEQPRVSSGLSELDRVLGGGIVAGSVILIGGDPGIGKSTLLLQTICHLSQQQRALYVTGEESLQQVRMRAQRLDLPQDKLWLLAETEVEKVIHIARQNQPEVLVIDSVQTIYTSSLPSAPGSVSQVREAAAALVRFAKQTGTALFIVGHVTKEGTLAGPRVLEHMVDTVLYFENERDSRFRLIRAVKNRFGAANELGIFVMAENGLRQVNNPSAIFLSMPTHTMSGSVVTVTWEGSRPMLLEVQALVDQSHLANPRRVTVGFELNRLAMLLAVLHRHGDIPTYQQDVFVNVVGGVKVTETATDLAQIFAILSSFKNRPMQAKTIVFGEVGLAGEIRPVQQGQERLREAAKHGFIRAIVPRANVPKKNIENMEVIGVDQLKQALIYL